MRKIVIDRKLIIKSLLEPLNTFIVCELLFNVSRYVIIPAHLRTFFRISEVIYLLYSVMAILYVRPIECLILNVDSIIFVRAGQMQKVFFTNISAMEVMITYPKDVPQNRSLGHMRYELKIILQNLSDENIKEFTIPARQKYILNLTNFYNMKCKNANLLVYKKRIKAVRTRREAQL